MLKAELGRDGQSTKTALNRGCHKTFCFQLTPSAQEEENSFKGASSRNKRLRAGGIIACAAEKTILQMSRQSMTWWVRIFFIPGLLQRQLYYLYLDDNVWK